MILEQRSVVTKFLFIPKCINWKFKWLVKAKWRQEVYSEYKEFGGIKYLKPIKYMDIEWVN